MLDAPGGRGAKIPAVRDVLAGLRTLPDRLLLARGFSKQRKSTKNTHYGIVPVSRDAEIASRNAT